MRQDLQKEHIPLRGGRFSLSRVPISALLGILLFFYFLLGLGYLLLIPPWYGADELAHYGYVRHLAEGRGIPLLGQAEYPGGPSYEAHQPPLYYCLLVPFYLLSRSLPEVFQAYLLRSLSLLLGGVTLLITFFLVRYLCPQTPEKALYSVTLFGLPAVVSLFASVNNDALILLLSALGLWLNVQLFCQGVRWGRVFGVGLVSGLAVWAKMSGLSLVLVGLFSLLLAGERGGGKGLKKVFGQGWGIFVGVYLIIVLLISGPWLMRNSRVYGDPLAARQVESFFLQRGTPTPEYFYQRMGFSAGTYWLFVGQWFIRSFVGAFPGRGNHFIFLPTPLYGFFWLLWGLSALRSLLKAFSLPQRGEGFLKSPLIPLWLIFLLITAGYLRLNSQVFWAQARYLFPALPFFCYVWGGLGDFPPLLRKFLLGLGLALLILANGVAWVKLAQYPW